jgi:hypothetical protein
MKKIILILLMASLLFSKDLPSDIVVNECMSDIYYINDMFVLEKDATRHKDELYNTILNEKYGGDAELMNSLHNFELLYNYSAREDFGDTPQALLFDALEAAVQLKDVSVEVSSVLFLADWFIGGAITSKLPLIKEAKSAFVAFLVKQGLAKELAEALVDEVLIGTIKNAISQEVAEATKYDADKVLHEDLVEMYDKFNKSLLEGHGIVVVTFGQGSLFDVQTIQHLAKDNRKLSASGAVDESGVEVIRNYIRHIHISSINYVGDGFRYRQTVQLNNDKSLFAGLIFGYFLPSTMQINRVNYFKYEESIKPEIDGSLIPISTTRPSVDTLELKAYWRIGVTPPTYTERFTFTGIADGAFSLDEAITSEHTAYFTPYEEKSLAFHSFEYYMGLKSISAYNGYEYEIVTSEETRAAIISHISNAIDAHNGAKSQWTANAEKANPQTCEDKITGRQLTSTGYMGNLSTGWSPAAALYIKSEPMYIFDYIRYPANTKVYKVDGKYVKAECGGVKIEQPDERSCHEIKNKDDRLRGRISGFGDCNYYVPNFHANLGLVNQTLAEFDLTLNVGVPGGHYCAQDRNGDTYVNLNDIGAGTYPIYVTYTGKANDAELKKKDIGLYMKPGSGSEDLWIRGMTLEEIDALENGHIADVILSIDQNLYPSAGFEFQKYKAKFNVRYKGEATIGHNY